MYSIFITAFSAFGFMAAKGAGLPRSAAAFRQHRRCTERPDNQCQHYGKVVCPLQEFAMGRISSARRKPCGPIGRVLPPKQESRLRQGPKTDRLQCACQTLHWFRLYCRAKLPVAAYGGEARQSPFTTNPKACVFRQIS